MLALIDGDVVVYRTGWASEKESEAIACVRANKTLEDILHETNATEYQVWFSDTLTNNFRLQFDPQYKANRLKDPKPKWYSSLKSFMTREWNAEVTPYQEADDILGIQQTAANEWEHTIDGPERIDETIICSIDKDLLQVPGLHYNFVKKVHVVQNYIEGLRAFYSQFLIGDRVDNIIGVDGIGPVKAARALEGCSTESEMFEKVRYLYKNDERLLRNGRMLWVRRYPDEIWDFPLNATQVHDEEGEHSAPTHGCSDGEQATSGSIL